MKPGVAAHTLSPAALKMAALSILPVPMRLQDGSLHQLPEAGVVGARHRWGNGYLESTYAVARVSQLSLTHQLGGKPEGELPCHDMMSVM